MYNPILQQDVEKLRSMLSDPSRVLIGTEIAEEYAHDELASTRAMPEMVCKCLCTAEVAAVMQYANERRIPVTPRGAGTGLVGAAVPIHGGIVMDVSGMNRILELDSNNLTITVEPGVLLMTLGEYCAERGFFYPPDPGEKTATIGGNISTNAGGMRAVRYGVTRDYVRGLEVVLPDGKIIEVGGKVVKNSSGYDLKDLFVGSEGTLGIVTRATLRLLALPKYDISLLVPFRSLAETIQAVPAIVRSDAQPTAVEFMQGEVIRDAENYLGSRFPCTSDSAYLLLKFDSMSREELDRQYRSASELCLSLGAQDVYLLDTEERNDSVWKPRGAFLEAIKSSTTEMDEVDVVVPRDSINEMVSALQGIAEKSGVRIKYFGHAGDGNLHIYILRDQLDAESWDRACHEAMERMYAQAFSLGGQVSGEHGIGFAKRPYLFRSLAPETLKLMQGIKAVFDPNNILNPGKVCQ